LILTHGVSSIGNGVRSKMINHETHERHEKGQRARGGGQEADFKKTRMVLNPCY
jgi:hypothetical protein